jgi:HSP20 family molecular chaperone IbpA
MDTETSTVPGGKRWISIERIMLLTILCLQVVILVWLWKEHNLKSLSASITAKAARPVTETLVQNQVLPGYPSVLAGRGRRMASAVAQMQEAQRMFAQMDSMFESVVHDAALPGPFMDFDNGWDALLTSPAMDMRERDKDYVVVFSFPGVKVSDVNVTLDGRLLTVVTEVPVGRDGHKAVFQRSIQLPGPVGEAQLASASITNGILRVSIPKGTGSESKAVRQKLL